MMMKCLLSVGVLLVAMTQQQHSWSVEAVATRSDNIVYIKHFLSRSHTSHHTRTLNNQRQRSSDSEEEDSWETPGNNITHSSSSSNSVWQESHSSLYLNDLGHAETAKQTLDRRFRYVFGAGHYQRKKKKRGKGRWIDTTTNEIFRPVVARRLENVNDDGGDDDANNNNADDDAYYVDDVTANADDAANADDGDDGNGNDDDGNYSAADERCSEFLVSFLEGTTDAHDTCEGMMNAYTAAECSASDMAYNANNDYDDYFNEFAEHECCQALMSHHRDYCDDDRLLSNFHLFAAASILLLCECAKAVVARANIHFIPEAAVCILVGTICGLLAHLSPSTDIDDISFDDELFLTVLLPPIIFEAALSVSKFEFKRRRGAIFMFSVFGTVISTFTSGVMVHYISKMSKGTTFPMLDSLVFGSLISSIDPVAILSVLTSLNMDQKDTIFILVFGESLLNDGIAITVFQTLVDRFDGKTNDGSASLDEIFDALASFLISMFGSIFVGLACGCGAWVYFFLLGRDLPPVMEVGSFFLWALIPWYISDGLGMSGIVSIVAVAFFIDIYIAGPKDSSRNGPPKRPSLEYDVDEHYQSMDHHQTQSMPSFESAGRSVGPLPSTERLHLSAIADRHVRFVAHLTAQLSENAIFAYLGLFLFSNNYDWDPTLVTISIFSCVVSRALMVVVVSWVILHIYKCRGMAGGGVSNSSKTAVAISDPRTQAVLVLAGLRGAVSLALVENVPIYNSNSGEGCEFKQLMKGMTSACILFTTFVFGGGAYYILPLLGISRDEDSASKSEELPPTHETEMRVPDAVVV